MNGAKLEVKCIFDLTKIVELQDNKTSSDIHGMTEEVNFWIHKLIEMV